MEGVVTSEENPSVKLQYVDAHVHLYDSLVVPFGVFERPDATFQQLVGDYVALPRTYLFNQYLQATRSRTVEGLVWHELIAEDTIGDNAWAKDILASIPIPTALVGLADFGDPDLEQKLELYGSIEGLSAVRQHLVWDVRNPLRRMAKRPDLMSDPAWLKSL